MRSAFAPGGSSLRTIARPQSSLCSNAPFGEVVEEMIVHGQPRNAKRLWPAHTSVRIPTRGVEYAYYLSLLFSALAPALGLEIPFVAGGMILIVSAICIRQVRSSAKVVYSPIGFLLACAMSFLFIQIAVHGESIMGGTVRVFIIWILQLIII